tara:strand:+ start:467 stop:1129 length:663 start_codon:yes stop_codon:yes gene_type:complete
MADNLFNFKTNINFIKRILSAIIIIPLMILPIIIGGYTLIIVYLLLLTLIVDELFNIIKNISNKYYGYLYICIIISSFFMFINILISSHVEKFFISIVFLIWAFDTFSYLGGSIIKGKKIFPKISKGKTYSGLFSGIIGVFFVNFIIMHYMNLTHPISYYTALLIASLSFMGDTIASLFKRYASIKDSGRIIPGHGGLLDRFDSFIFVFLFIGIFNSFFV